MSANFSKQTKTEKQEGFKHKKSLGQNFLTSDVVPNWMCDAGDIKSGDTVLEIGPGTGALTKALLARKARVLAVETDIRAVEELQKTFVEELKNEQLILIHKDIRELSFSEIGLKNSQYKVVANIPYYLSGFLLRFLLENEIKPSSITFLIQKELAFRIARDKKESILSLSVKVFGEPKYIKTVARGHFYPKPNVDSAILLIENINSNHLPNQELQDIFFSLLHLGLGNKRKQLFGNLRKEYNDDELDKIFNTLKLDKKVRGEDVSLENWLNLAKKLAVFKRP